MARKSVKQDPSKLRSRKWFANPDNPNMTALYLERYMNFGLKREELQAGKPIIGIAQSGSDLCGANCQSSGNWCLEETAAMLLPSVTIKRNRSR